MGTWDPVLPGCLRDCVEHASAQPDGCGIHSSAPTHRWFLVTLEHAHLPEGPAFSTYQSKYLRKEATNMCCVTKVSGDVWHSSGGYGWGTDSLLLEVKSTQRAGVLIPPGALQYSSGAVHPELASTPRSPARLPPLC